MPQCEGIITHFNNLWKIKGADRVITILALDAYIRLMRPWYDNEEFVRCILACQDGIENAEEITQGFKDKLEKKGKHNGS